MPNFQQQKAMKANQKKKGKYGLFKQEDMQVSEVSDKDFRKLLHHSFGFLSIFKWDGGEGGSRPHSHMGIPNNQNRKSWLQHLVAAS